MPRKHLISEGINKKQQLQSKIWQKLAREIKAAVKVGGPNVDANPRLRAAIDKALQNNLSRESIEKNVNGSSKDPSELLSQEYECYGPEGIQIIVQTLTDNPNRTQSSLRGYLSKLHGEISKPNSVKIFFEKYGQIILTKNFSNEMQSKDDIEETILEKNLDGYVDTNEFDDHFEVLTEPNDSFYSIKDALMEKGYKVYEAAIKLISQNKLESISQETEERLQRFLESCDEDEDIQHVVTNYE